MNFSLILFIIGILGFVLNRKNIILMLKQIKFFKIIILCHYFSIWYIVIFWNSYYMFIISNYYKYLKKLKF